MNISIERLNNMIDDVKEKEYEVCYPIEEFHILHLTELAKLAKREGIEVRLFEERSNFYQGVLLGLKLK